MASDLNPYDTPVSAASRFGIELVAWIAGPWALAAGVGSGWVAVPAVAVLVALPALFNVPGDKKVTGVAIPGQLRVAIEIFLLLVAVVGAWLVWPRWIALVVALLGIVMLVAGVPRYRWLLADAAGA